MALFEGLCRKHFIRFSKRQRCFEQLIRDHSVTFSIYLFFLRTVTSSTHFRFSTRDLTLAANGQFTRFFASWIVEEYLVVTGDRSGWIRLTPANLAAAILAAQSTGSFPACVDFVLSSSSLSPTPVTVKALFMKSGGTDLLLGMSSVTCPNPENYNDNTAPIYGEVSTSGTPLLNNNFLSRNGFNVFVKVLPANVPSIFCFRTKNQ